MIPAFPASTGSLARYARLCEKIKGMIRPQVVTRYSALKFSVWKTQADHTRTDGSRERPAFCAGATNGRRRGDLRPRDAGSIPARRVALRRGEKDAD